MGFDSRIAAGDSRMIELFGNSTLAAFDIVNNISVIFSEESEMVLEGTGEVLITGPEVICKTSDVPEPKNKTIKINNTLYTILDHKPDKYGMTVLSLSEDE